LTDLVIPIPSGASYIGNLLNGSQDTCSIVKVISYITTQTGSSTVECIALRRYRYANFVIIEDPVAGALKADLVVPIPSGAADVSDLLGGGQHALSIVKVISYIATQTGSGTVECVALV
jgi:hypothetical protein